MCSFSFLSATKFSRSLSIDSSIVPILQVSCQEIYDCHGTNNRLLTTIVDFLAHLVDQPKAWYNHALSVVRRSALLSLLSVYSPASRRVRHGSFIFGRNTRRQ